MITSLSNLNAYIIEVYRMPGGYEEEVKAMVKTFYDPKVEARGEVKGEVKAKAETLIMQLNQRFGNIEESYKKRIMKLEIAELDNILLNIFSLNELEDIEKYLT